MEDGRYKMHALVKGAGGYSLSVLKLDVSNGVPRALICTIPTTAGDQEVWRLLEHSQLEPIKSAEAQFLCRQTLVLPSDVQSIWHELYGHVRPFVHAEGHGMRFVAAGNRVFYSDPKGKPWKYVADFLKAFAEQTFGREWILEEIKKPQEQQHQIVKFHAALYGQLKNAPKDEKGDFAISPCGLSNYFYDLAYDLFVLQDNGALPEKLVARLKQKGQFQGARHEVFAAATCIRAGFKITYEDEADGSKTHPEFVATHSDTRLRIAVEAKSRHRAGILDAQVPGKKKANPKAEITQLLNQALAKSVTLPYVIFIDLNLPPSEGPAFQSGWFKEINQSISKNLGASSPTKQDRFNMIVFTNHPLHYGESSLASPAIEPAVCLKSQYPVNPLTDPSVLNALIRGADLFGVIPKAFPLMRQSPWEKSKIAG